MNKKSIIAILIIVVLIGGYILLENNNLGGQMIIGSSYFGATNSSSSVPTVATTTNPILSLDNTRTNAIVCNNSVNTVFLHPKSQATTTGVVLNEGIPLFGAGLTTSTKICHEFPGFKGYLYGISSAVSAITVSSWR